MTKGITVTFLFSLFAVGIVSGIYDCATATPQVIEVLVLDKDYSPPHDDTSCATDSNGRMSCSTTHYGPTWSVEYADVARHTTTVSQGTYDALHVGEKKILRFNQGNGWWHGRYDEQFQFGPVDVEGVLPVK